MIALRRWIAPNERCKLALRQAKFERAVVLGVVLVIAGEVCWIAWRLKRKEKADA